MRRILALLVLAAAPAAAQFHADVIYGTDTRRDLYEVTDPKQLALADSTVSLFQSGDVATDGAVARLATLNYGISLGLCREEPFFEQGRGSFCSGVLVAPDVVLTAGHCAQTTNACLGVKFVFGFAMKQKGVMPDSVPASEVYDCKNVIAGEQTETGPDWALVRLTRKVAGHKPLKLDLAGAIAKNAPVMVIGNPQGLPLKIADGAHVRDSSNPDFFVANLDTYGGNSGSPVFNSATGLVEGVIVRGEVDYVKKDACLVSNVCPADGCRGEDVTKISVVADRIPAAVHSEIAVQLRRELSDILANMRAQ